MVYIWWFIQSDVLHLFFSTWFAITMVQSWTVLAVLAKSSKSLLATSSMNVLACECLCISHYCQRTSKASQIPFSLLGPNLELLLTGLHSVSLLLACLLPAVLRCIFRCKCCMACVTLYLTISLLKFYHCILANFSVHSCWNVQYSDLLSMCE